MARRPPHRISLRLPARLLRLPLKGGAISLGARASRPHPCSLWGLLSISATLQAATTSAGTATAGSKESQGAVGSIQGREKNEAVPVVVRAGRPRSQVAFDGAINREHGLHPVQESRARSFVQASSITPPLRGSRRDHGEASSRAGGGLPRRPVSDYRRHGQRRLRGELSAPS